MPNILDEDEQSILAYLKLTGQTREELVAELALVEDVDKPGMPLELKGTDPALKEKFTMPVGFELADKK